MKRRRVQSTERGERGRQKGGKQNLHRVVKELCGAAKGMCQGTEDGIWDGRNGALNGNRVGDVDGDVDGDDRITEHLESRLERKRSVTAQWHRVWSAVTDGRREIMK